MGSLLIAVALWRAATVPRWVPIVGAIAAVAGILLPPDGLPGLIGEAASSVSTVALGWYAWQRSRIRTPSRRLRRYREAEVAG